MNILAKTLIVTSLILYGFTSSSKSKFNLNLDHFKKFRGILPFGSEYLDEGKNKKYLIQGTLFLFQYKESQSQSTRLFGLTASHVSQGNSTLFLDGKPIPQDLILGRLANNDEDLEIIEFTPGSLDSIAEWNPKKELIQVDTVQINEWLNHPELVNRSKVRMTDEKRGGNFVLKGEWVTTQSEPFSQNVDLTTSYENDGKLKEDWFKLFYLPIEDEIYALARISPGMSGSPLLTNHSPRVSELNYKAGEDHLANILAVVLGDLSHENEDQSHSYVLGIAKSSDRYVPGSWFVTEKSISNILQSYLKGSRNTTNQTQWKMRFGLTYRDYGNGNAEINPASYKTGGFSRGDGGFSRCNKGGLGRSDNGGLDRGDSGASVFCSLSEAVYESQFWKILDITPGVKYNYSPILGFLNEMNLGFYVEGSPQKVLTYFSSLLSSTTNTISLTSDLRPFLISKLKTLLEQKMKLSKLELQYSEGDSMTSKMKLEHSNYKMIAAFYRPANPDDNEQKLIQEIKRLASMSEEEYVNHSRLELEQKIKNYQIILDKKLNPALKLNEKTELTLRSEMFKSPFDPRYTKISFNQQKVHFILQFLSPQVENLDFELDRYGRLLKDNKPLTTYFSPYITVFSSSKKAYYVDLRSLYFVNTSTVVNLDENPGPLKVPKTSSFSERQWERVMLEGPLMRIRSEGSPQIYEIQFNAVD